MTQTKTFKTRLPLFLVFSILFFTLSNECSSQSSSVNISTQIDARKKQAGEALIHTEEGKFKLYGSFSKNKLTSLYAIDNNGKKIEVTYKKEKNMDGGETCFSCVTFLGMVYCQVINCSQVPPPKIKNVQ